jgi:hypothetical protein
MLEEPKRLHSSEYQAYAIVTMCRVLYTLEHGTIVSKPVSARWADTMSSWTNLTKQWILSGTRLNAVNNLR